MARPRGRPRKSTGSAPTPVASTPAVIDLTSEDASSNTAGRLTRSASLKSLADATQFVAIVPAQPTRTFGRGKRAMNAPTRELIEMEDVSRSESVSSVPTAASSESAYSTPATSKVPTPAATDLLPRSGSKIEVRLPAYPQSASFEPDRERALRDSIYAMKPSTKRKPVIHDSDDDLYDDQDSSADARLARRLQNEERFKGEPKHLTLSRRRSGRIAAAEDMGTRFAASIDTTAPLKRSRASTGTDVSTSRATKRSKVIPDSDESDIDMDAEIAAGVNLSLNQIEYKSSDDVDDDSFNGPEEISDVSDGSGDSSDDQPIARTRQRRRGGAAATVNAGTTLESDDDEPLALTQQRRRGGVINTSRSLPTRPNRRPAPVPTAPLPVERPPRLLGDSSSDWASDDMVDFMSSGLSDLDSDEDPSATQDVPRNTLRQIASQRRAYRRNGNNHRLQKERDRLESNHPEIKTMWTDLEKMPVLKAGKAEQPTTISRQLKPFQLEGLAWMKEMEKIDWKGGLLGDEMGLGKTIQAVSLIMSDYPAKQPSLVLVPPVALMQWQQEIKSYTDGTLKTLVFHGTNQKTKGITVKELKKYDVIMMSYNSLESIYRKQEKGFKRKDGIYKEKSVVHSINFHRVILDEAHCIKTRTTMTAKACFALKTEYRWCLTGTPLQNRIGEFFSLVRFLNIRPFASYLCKQCPCSTLEWSMNEHSRCHQCGHAGMQHVSVFNQELLNPIQKFGNFGPGKDAFRKLRLMTDRIMLRRLKKDHTNSMELPVKEIYVDRQFFGEEENDFANSIMTNGQRKFDTYVAQGVLLNNYANIFGLIMQMRQVADHPDLLLKKNAEGGQNILVCCICDEPAEDTVRSRCKHDFCRTCVSTYVHSTDEPDCPRCHIPLSIDLEQPEIEQDEALVKKSSIINRIKMENWTSSSKIELLVHELHKLRSDNASHKSIIFSQFTTMLQLIEWRLRRAGITTVMLDGSMTPAQRQASIEHFMTNVDVECFLVSLKAGGVALNLTEASRVFIVDPWWNPAAEWQSADRCHRIGQTRPCTITRLCIEDSVESRMVLIQEKKTNMINSTVNADDKAMESLSPQDMQFLFRGS